LTNQTLKKSNSFALTSIARSFFLTILTVHLILISSDIKAQEHEEEEEIEILYTRPDFRIYKSITGALAQPDSVFILDLKGKQLKEFPEQVLQLPNLLVLDLSKNKLKSIPPSISQLANLEELDLSGNKLTSLPTEIGELVKLKKLSLNKNVITELPVSIGNMTLLEILELWDNELGTLPDEIKNLKKLKKLELRGILFSEEHQQYFHELLPNTKIYMSPPCDCKTF
jgi:Leucine-rich repeat (LRR) protein